MAVSHVAHVSNPDVVISSQHFFFATRATTKGMPNKFTGKPIQTVAVLGGGTMGAGICIVYLLKGYNVILKEINEKQVLAGVERIVNDLQRVAKVTTHTDRTRRLWLPASGGLILGHSFRPCHLMFLFLFLFFFPCLCSSPRPAR